MAGGGKVAAVGLVGYQGEEGSGCGTGNIDRRKSAKPEVV